MKYAALLAREFPVRRKKEEKAAFCRWLSSELKKMGYPAAEQTAAKRLGEPPVNIIAGDPHTAKLILTAYYDTPGREIVPPRIFPMRPVTYALYQAITPIIGVVAAFLISLALTFALGLPGVTFPLFLLLLLGVMLYPRFAPPETRTANGNTSGVAALLETAEKLTPRYRGEVAFAFLDGGTIGMTGAKSFRKKYPEARERTVLCVDCVGRGDEIVVLPGKHAGWDGNFLDAVNAGFACSERKTVFLKAGGMTYYPGNPRCFRYGVAVFACDKIKGFGRVIRPAGCKTADEENIEILRDGFCNLIASYQINKE